MSWVQELIQVFSKFRPYEIVYEYQQGLKFRNGRVKEVRKKNLTEADLSKARKEETALFLKEGKLKYLLPFANPQISKDFKRSFYSGLPLHKSRFSKILQPGIYVYFPLVEDIIKESSQERILNLESIAISTMEQDSNNDSPRLISCNMRYKVNDIYKACVEIHDYEQSLKDHTLSILAKYSRGKKLSDWSNPLTIIALERSIEEELKKTATEKWGLKIQKVYITDNVETRVQKMIHTGSSLANYHMLLTQDNSETIK